MEDDSVTEVEEKKSNKENLNFYETLGFEDPKKNNEVQFIFDTKRDKKNMIPYHKDGRPIMYTKKKIAERKALKSHKMVSKSINNFMEVFKFEHTNEIGRNEYIRIYLLLARILRPDLPPDGRAALV